MKLQTVIKSFLLLLLTLVVFACNDDKDAPPDVSGTKINLRILHLEDSIRQVQNLEELKALMERHHGLRYLFQPFHGRYDELYQSIQSFKNGLHNDTLVNDVERIFNDFDRFKDELRMAYKHVKYYFPRHETPTIYTLVSGFGNYGYGGDLLLFPKSVFIGLDYFGGAEMTYRPPEVPLYILKRYTPEYLVPSVMKLQSQDFIHYDQDKSMLADMIFYGKALYFSEKMLPNTPDSILIGYSDLEMKQADFNEERIWTHFLNNNLIYEVSERVKSKYLGERPNTSEISPEAPGRLGRWLGWQIVRSYAEKHPDMDLRTLLSHSDSREFFQKSGYKPKLRE
jgi:hypothetical protein